MRRVVIGLGLSFLVALPIRASPRRRPHGKSPHVEITAVARVETAPQRKTHKNGREFEEFDAVILSAEPGKEQRPGGDADLAIERRGQVHVVHDLTCGGSWLEAKPGDRIEFKGEYVHPPRGGDLIHFTHPADAKCGSGGHPEGYLRLAPSAPAAEAAAALPAGDLFTTSVRPVLARRCLCHEKGGKMYARLPFDDPNVVSSHADGVRRRLKGDDLAALERWLAATSAAPAARSENPDRP